MSNRDQVLHALLHGAGTQLSDAVLGDDHVGQVTGHGHDGAGIQDGSDSGDGALLGSGDLAQHSTAALGVISAVSIVGSAAGAGPLGVANGLSSNLTGQVDLQGSVDGNHVILLCDDHGVVGVTAAAHHDTGMVVQIVIGEVVSDDESTNGPALIQVLITVGDNALLDHVSHGSADLLGVDAQVVTVHQVEADGVGDAAEAQLDAVAVVNHLSSVACDSLLSLADGGILQLVQIQIGLDDHVSHSHGQSAVAGQVGDAGVNLEDDLVSGVEGLHLPLQVAGHAAVAVLVHAGHAHDNHVGALAAVQFLAIVVQVDREVGGHAGGMDLPEVAVIEEGLMMELVLQLRIGVNLILRTPAMHAGPQLNGVVLVDAVGDAVQVPIEQTGLAAVDGVDDAVAALDEGQGVVHGAQLALIDLLMGHACIGIVQILLVLLMLLQHNVGDVTIIIFVMLEHIGCILLSLISTPVCAVHNFTPLSYRNLSKKSRHGVLIFATFFCFYLFSASPFFSHLVQWVRFEEQFPPRPALWRDDQSP